MGSSIQEALFAAEQEFANGHFLEARAILKEALHLDPASSRANELMAYILWNQGDEKQGFRYLTKAVNAPDCSHSALYEMATLLTNEGNYVAAIPLFERSLQKSGGFFELYHEYGRALASSGDYQESLNLFAKAEAINPNSTEVLFNLGRLSELLQNQQKALYYYEKVLNIDPSFGPAWNNKASILNDCKRYKDALASYERALALDPRSPELMTNKGVSLSNLGSHLEAMECYSKALEINPRYFLALEAGMYSLCTLKQYRKALAYAERALQLAPSHPFLFGFVAHLRMLICDWNSFYEDVLIISNQLNAGQAVILPFQALCIFDDPSLQYRCAEIFAQSQAHQNGTSKQDHLKRATQKIRIGYFSSDFGYHPVSFLIAEVFELHDRERFEVIGFSVGPDTGDPMRKRLEKAFDEFYDVSHLQDIDIAKLSRAENIDIAIDLTGYTQDSRTTIFSHQAAPVQVNYLGYPGTLGTSFFDYIIADKVLIPQNMQRFFAEKIVYLPHSYQPNDRSRQISNNALTRSMYGLAEDNFIFCCFNNNFKITPEVFGLWMDILKNIDNSVLWLLEDNIDASNNLKNFASRHGVEESRLIFAKRAPMDEHIARMRLADLFLDTLPYNAHTTASDALWAGLPVLTMVGKSFAGRVAASLLNAVGLSELAVDSGEAYVKTAVALAKDPECLAQIRSRLVDGKTKHPLFDTALYVKGLEEAFIKMHTLSQAGKSAETFFIS
jgi:protein O-GlcNAc transferase